MELRVFILSKNLLEESIVSVKYVIMLSAYRDSLISSLPIFIPFIFLISYCSKILRTILSKNGELGILVSFQEPEERPRVSSYLV